MSLITCIHCPVCDSGLKLDVAVKIKNRLQMTDAGVLSEKRELSSINIRRIEASDDKWLTIIERIQPYICPGLTIDDLAGILKEEFNVCTAHTPILIEKIKEAYDLYTKDGKTLVKID